MKLIRDLNFGYSDAENYKRSENRELFNHLFMRSEHLEKLVNPATSFLVGDKGTGKTAYAVYMANNSYRGNQSVVNFIRETEYQKFIHLKTTKQLALSDYVSIWKVAIYVLLSRQVYEHEGGKSLLGKFGKFRALQEAIDEYYSHAFSPEIIQALRFVEESRFTAELLLKYAKLGGESLTSMSFTDSRFQTNLLFVQKRFESAFRSLKLKNNHVIFIDGIDIRPDSVPYEDYLQCIKGLANAVWEINNDFFPTIKDSPGRLRAVLLIRPDIFCSLALQNQNTKIRDNAVLLNWVTTYNDYRSSKLFAVSDRLLSHDQDRGRRLAVGDAWDHYFPWNSPTEKFNDKEPSSFISFLRFAYYRPRDIVTMLGILKERFVETATDQNRAFTISDFDDPVFRRLYADYLLGEVKDQLLFYYSADDYEIFLNFFKYLNGKNEFSYDTYVSAYDEHQKTMDNSSVTTPIFMSSATEFLQFLFELNVLCYKEVTEGGKVFIHWSFRERNYANIAPKVKIGMRYEIFYGMAKAVNTGSKLKRQTR